MKYLLSLFLLLAVIKAKAQNCNCGDNFSFMVERIKKNYVGYPDKITKENRKQFEVFTDSLQQIANKTESNKCISLCNEWLNFFKDQHMILAFNEENPKNAIMEFFIKEEKTTWDEDKLKTYLAKHKNQTDSIEGIWSNSTNSRKYGIVRDSSKKDNFIGFIIKGDGVLWVPQQIKFKIIKTNKNYRFTSFLAKDHSNYPSKISLIRDTVEFTGLGKLYKNDVPKNMSYDVSSPKFKKLDDKTCLLTIPSFNIMYRKKTDSLMITSASILEKANHLIIDLRNNTGGSVSAFEKILPYLYTNPIQTDGGQVLATDDNIKDGFEEISSELPEDIQKYFRDNLVKLKAHRGELYLLYPSRKIKYPAILKNPSRVSIIMNEESGSAAEIFILQAKQSTKVQVYGSNSAGAVNYVERVTTKMPCPFFTLIYPPTRSLRANIKGITPFIKPDVEISKDIKDWVKFVRDYKL